MTLPYMAEPWFAVLQAARQSNTLKVLGDKLGVSVPTLCQVLGGTGLYGEGKASTARIAERVMHQLGQFVCPHLTAENGADQVITADECRAHAHRNPPIGSPRALAHWQACQRCPLKALSAPAAPRVIKPRKPKGVTVSTPVTDIKDTASATHQEVTP